PCLPSFPTRRSSDLVCQARAIEGPSVTQWRLASGAHRENGVGSGEETLTLRLLRYGRRGLGEGSLPAKDEQQKNKQPKDELNLTDRKSTRLNSSHQI